MRKIKALPYILIINIFMLLVNTITVQAEEYWPEGPEVIGESVIVMEVSTGTVLYEKNSHEKLYPASITKILTTLLAIENTTDLQDVVTFSHDAVYKTEGSGVARDVDEELTMEECLYAIMLASANEVSYAVAEHVGNGYDNFVNMMNERAKELGCKDTNFSNPHGLPDENHYTTAYDMALISRDAIQNETFALITNTKFRTLPETNKHDESLPMPNHHKMLHTYKGDARFLLEECVGGKTGYTVAAQNTLVTFAERNGMLLLCVVMNETGPNHYLDTKTMFDYCFENFKIWNVSANETDYGKSINLKSGIFSEGEKFVDLDKSGQIILPKTVSFTEAKSQVTQRNDSGKVIATLQYDYAGKNVGGADIKVTGAKVQQFPFGSMDIDDKLSNGMKGSVVNFSVRNIIFGIVIFLAFAVVVFAVYKIIDNFYLLKYKWSSRKYRGFKGNKLTFLRRRFRRR